MGLSLQEFIIANRGELILRCRDKVASRAAPAASTVGIARGVPLFLEQLIEELGDGGTSQTGNIAACAGAHGRDLRELGSTIGLVVHDYGDVCQAVTDLAVERSAPISTEDFRTLNRCLDNAIAGAVTQFTHGSMTASAGTFPELRELVKTAIAAFEVLQTGSVGVAGRTGTLVYVSLLNIDAILDRQRPAPADSSAP